MKSITCPAIGNHHSGQTEISIPEMEITCIKALSYTASPSYKSVENILVAGKDKPEKVDPKSESAKSRNSHAITRGGDYYRR